MQSQTNLQQNIKEKPIKRTLFGVLRKNSNLKCLLLTFLIHGCLVAIIWCRNTQVTKILLDFDAFPITRTRQVSPCDDGVIYIPSAFVIMLYLLYLVECWHSKTRIQLSLPKVDIKTAYSRIQEMREAQPIVWWKAICYHYVRRVRQMTRYRNGGSYTSSQVFYERVNSNAVASYFFYSLCGMRDISSDIVDLEKYPATKIKLTKGFIFANVETATQFEEQRSVFFQEQGRLDDYMEMRESFEFSNTNFKDSIMAWTSPQPWFARNNIFWMFSFVLLSWPIRILIELNTAHLNYRVTKLFGINSPNSPRINYTHPPLLYSNSIEKIIKQRRNNPTRISKTRYSPNPNNYPLPLTLNRPNPNPNINNLPKEKEKNEFINKKLFPRSITLTLTLPIQPMDQRKEKDILNFNYYYFMGKEKKEYESIPTYSQALLMEPQHSNSNPVSNNNTSSSSSNGNNNNLLYQTDTNIQQHRINNILSSTESLIHQIPSTSSNNYQYHILQISSDNMNNENGENESPPTYIEALRTSRPVFFPGFTRLRRCLTERDLSISGIRREREEEKGWGWNWINRRSLYFLERINRIRLNGINNTTYNRRESLKQDETNL